VTPTTRLRSLDGLRGVAALAVLLYHTSLIARPFLDTGTRGDAWWWLTETPLKLATAGTEAVLVFFVLSGLVVALPVLRPGFSWRRYYPTRLARLYLPIWGSLALAALLVLLVPRPVQHASSGSWLLRASSTTVDGWDWLREATLWPRSYDLNNVLWSLRWEVLFSLALPLFVGAALLARGRWWWPAVLLCVAAPVAGRLWSIDALVYLPAFLLGTLLAMRLPQLRDWAQRRGPWAWAAMSSASCLLLVASWAGRSLAPEPTALADALWGLSGAGAAGLVVVAIGSGVGRRMLEARPAQWLGKVSFSLYLVQAPLLATIAFAAGDRQWPLIAAIGIPSSLLLAWLFQLAIERPSHRFARWLGARADRRQLPTSTAITLPAGSLNQAISGPLPRWMPRSSPES
jgi:peptidoglycan/LPS O-acetylase OafA/YrhL